MGGQIGAKTVINRRCCTGTVYGIDNLLVAECVRISLSPFNRIRDLLSSTAFSESNEDVNKLSGRQF